MMLVVGYILAGIVFCGILLSAFVKKAKLTDYAYAWTTQLAYTLSNLFAYIFLVPIADSCFFFIVHYGGNG